MNATSIMIRYTMVPESLIQQIGIIVTSVLDISSMYVYFYVYIIALDIGFLYVSVA